MAKQTINLGSGPNTGTGEPIRTAFGKVNDNFTEVYDIAQGAYDYANTIVSDTQIDPLARSTANAAYDEANSASVLGQLALDGANALSGSVSSLQSVTISLNTDVIEAQNTANIAWSTANSAFDAANNAGGNPFDQDLNTSNNVTFDTVTAANVQVDSITIGIGGNVNGQGSILGNFSEIEATEIEATEITTSNAYIGSIILLANTLLTGDESKILSVANSSGDGEGYTTLRLIPDDTIESFDQYLIIDPTDPTHIHIRAGGTQDDSNADLFLGGENSYFHVYAGLDPAVEIAANNNTWYFGVDGTLRFPDSSIQTTAFTLTPTLDSLTVNGSSKLAKVVEPFSAIADATGVITHDCTNNHIFYHTSLDANFTANFTNLSLANGEATSLTLVLDQGATAYIANTVQIEGNAQTIKWFANTEPTGNVNSVDVMSFSVLKNSGTFVVLGQLSTFG